MARGETITGWAKARGFTAQQVFEVLAGRNLGRRGKAHRIAIALGLKRQPRERAARTAQSAYTRGLQHGVR